MPSIVAALHAFQIVKNTAGAQRKTAKQFVTGKLIPPLPAGLTMLLVNDFESVIA